MSKRTLVSCALAGALTLGPALASAQQGMLQQMSWHAGAGGGWYGFDDSSLDDDDWALKLYGGGRFGHYLGAELGYINFGEVEEGAASFEGDAVTASVLGYWPLANIPLTPFGKLGAAFWDADVNSAGGLDDEGTDFLWGVGAHYDLGQFGIPELGVRVEYEQFDIDDADANVVSASAVWQF